MHLHSYKVSKRDSLLSPALCRRRFHSATGTYGTESLADPYCHRAGGTATTRRNLCGTPGSCSQASPSWATTPTQVHQLARRICRPPSGAALLLHSGALLDYHAGLHSSRYTEQLLICVCPNRFACRCVSCACGHRHFCDHVQASGTSMWTRGTPFRTTSFSAWRASSLPSARCSRYC